MTIEAVDVGPRLVPASVHPEDWTSTGVSMAGIATRQDFGITKTDVQVNLMLTAATLSSLQAALGAVRRGGYATVVPDSGDDLGIGATSSVELVYMDQTANFVGGTYWAVSLLFTFYA
jgi:hypothetical protein